jgi:hypothetical protein
VYAKRVPHDLSDEQRGKCMVVCQQNHDFLLSMINYDESWMRHYDLTLKQWSGVGNTKIHFHERNYSSALAISEANCEWCLLFRYLKLI